MSSSALRNGLGRWLVLAMLPAALLLASCGGSDDSGSSDGALTANEVVVAFEDAAGGYEFEEATSLVDGAVAYGPVSSPDPTVVEPLNKALGESSVLWQVYVFDGPEPPLDEEAAKEAAFASNTFEEVSEGVFLGDNDIAYLPHENVVVSGPVLEGDVDDETLKRWQAVLEEL